MNAHDVVDNTDSSRDRKRIDVDDFMVVATMFCPQGRRGGGGTLK